MDDWGSEMRQMEHCVGIQRNRLDVIDVRLMRRLLYLGSLIVVLECLLCGMWHLLTSTSHSGHVIALTFIIDSSLIHRLNHLMREQ
jgi:hypothetical protein